MVDQKKLEAALVKAKKSLTELRRLKRMGMRKGMRKGVAGTEEGRWRLVHAATGYEMFLANDIGGASPEQFCVMWRRPPGADFTRREATALGSAYIAVTGDHRVRIEPLAEGGGGEAPPGEMVRGDARPSEMVRGEG